MKKKNRILVYMIIVLLNISYSVMSVNENYTVSDDYFRQQNSDVNNGSVNSYTGYNPGDNGSWGGPLFANSPSDISTLAFEENDWDNGLGIGEVTPVEDGLPILLLFVGAYILYRKMKKVKAGYK